MKLALLAVLLAAPARGALVNVITPPAAPAAVRPDALAALRALNDELLRLLFLGPAPAPAAHAAPSARRTRSVSSESGNGF